MMDHSGKQKFSARRILLESLGLIVAVGLAAGLLYQRDTGGVEWGARSSSSDAKRSAARVDFSGSTIEWVVPFNPGGGTDTWARFNAPFLSKYLPGRPTIIISNVPGGGSTVGASRFAERAEPNGLKILATSGSTQFPFLLKDKRAHYDYDDFFAFVISPTGGVVYVSPDLQVASAEDIAKLHKRKLVYANQGASSLDLVPLLAFRLLGLDVRHVFGFTGRGEGRIAFERGEANIDYQTSSSYLQNVEPLVALGEAVPLFSWGTLDDEGNLVRDPTFPDLPHFAEVYESLGNDLSGIEWEAFRAFFASGFAAQKMGLLPNGTSPRIIRAYQDAIRSMQTDLEYQKRKVVALGNYEQKTGEAAARLKELATTVSDDARQYVMDLLRREYDIRLDL